MIHIGSYDIWNSTYKIAKDDQLGELSRLMRSFNERPFVDVMVTDAYNCPFEFPEDLVYDIWPGTTGHCDCLEQEGARQFTLSMCNRSKEGSQKGPDCHDRAGLAPIVQNRFNGLRYCSKHSSKPFSDMTRPMVDPTNTAKYKCPAGTVPCNSAFFSQPNGEQFVICRDQNSAIESECPITDAKFKIENSERSLYEWRGLQGSDSASNKGIWISRKVMNHGLEQMTFSPEHPCKDRAVYNAAPNQQFFFAEFRALDRR